MVTRSWPRSYGLLMKSCAPARIASPAAAASPNAVSTNTIALASRAAHLAQQLEAAAARHAQVGEHRIEGPVAIHPLQRLRRRTAPAPPSTTRAPAPRRAGCRRPRRRRPAAGGEQRRSCRRFVKVRGATWCPGRPECARVRPPCARARRRLTARPSPVPASPLVETKGLNSCCCMIGARPGPSRPRRSRRDRPTSRCGARCCRRRRAPRSRSSAG